MTPVACIAFSGLYHIKTKLSVQQKQLVKFSPFGTEVLLGTLIYRSMVILLPLDHGGGLRSEWLL